MWVWLDRWIKSSPIVLEQTIGLSHLAREGVLERQRVRVEEDALHAVCVQHVFTYACRVRTYNHARQSSSSRKSHHHHAPEAAKAPVLAREGRPAVQVVAEHGAAQVRQVHADLMRPSWGVWVRFGCVCRIFEQWGIDRQAHDGPIPNHQPLPHLPVRIRTRTRLMLPSVAIVSTRDTARRALARSSCVGLTRWHGSTQYR